VCGSDAYGLWKDTLKSKAEMTRSRAMQFSPHSLHPTIALSDTHKNEVRLKARALFDELRKRALGAAPRAAAHQMTIPLTTVSLAGNFDAYISIQFRGQAPGPPTSLLVDSGNSNLIVPSWEAIEGLPGYTVLGEATEPWGSPAKVVRGPIDIPAANGDTYSLEDVVFYACTGNPRTANFGAARPNPWSANGWNTPGGLGVTMQAPLSYNGQFPFAEFNYAAASSILVSAMSPTVSQESMLILSQTLPAGYSLFDVLPNLEWMALTPKSLSIGNTATSWPGNVPNPIALVDTGGGPVFLSDPNGYVYANAWPHPVMCPAWASTSQEPNCVSDDLTIEVAGSNQASTYKYAIQTGSLPPSVQGLTGVLCKVCAYMMGQQGMNIGGISALFNNVLVDYANSRVGFGPK
jgi:hypothetical protein